MRLTPSDHEILDALARNVRSLAVAQVAAHWYSGNLHSAERRVQRLQADGWLTTTKRLASLVVPTGARAIVRPGDPPADWGAICYHCRQRFGAPYLHTILTSSPKANAFFGGRKRPHPSRGSELSHDLLHAAVFLVQPACVQHVWCHEDMIPAGGDIRLDTWLSLPEGPTALEVVGSRYTPERLEKLYLYCQEEGAGLVLC